MNTQFRNKLASAGIDFTRFLIGIAGALASANNPKYSKLIEEGSTILQAHLDTLPFNDDTPATALAIDGAEKDGGFPGAPRPGSTAVAVNGHHDDTTAPENKPGYVEPAKDAPPGQVAAVVATPAAAVAAIAAPTPTEDKTSARITALESSIGQILALLNAANAKAGADVAATPGERI